MIIDEIIKALKESGFKIVSNPMVIDYTKRTWKQKWFSIPWEPLREFDYSPRAYFIPDEKIIICSPRTEKGIKELIK